MKKDYYEKVLKVLSENNYSFSKNDLKFLLNSSKENVRNLRQQYKTFPCSVDYSKGELRAAYLIGYYPYYIDPSYDLLKRIQNKIFSLINRKEIKVSAFGCGPAPEAVGISNFFKEHSSEIKKITYNFFDKEKGWLISRQKLLKEFLSEEINYTFKDNTCNILTDCVNCLEAKKCLNKSKNNLIIIQNCLNDISAELKIKKIKYMMEEFLEKEGIIIIIDLNFQPIFTLLKSLEKEFSEEVLLPVEKIEQRAPFILPEIIRENIFDESHGLVPKTKVIFYTLILKKRNFSRN